MSSIFFFYILVFVTWSVYNKVPGAYVFVYMWVFRPTHLCVAELCNALRFSTVLMTLVSPVLNGGCLVFPHYDDLLLVWLTEPLLRD